MMAHTTMRGRMFQTKLHDEEGSVLLLTIFSALLALAVILGVMAASSAAGSLKGTYLKPSKSGVKPN